MSGMDMKIQNFLTPYLNLIDNYWFVGDDETQVYSSKRRQLVPVSDVEFQEFTKDRIPLRAPTIEALRNMLAERLGDGDSEHHGRE